ATPVGFTLALTLPAVDDGWLQGFSDGLAACAADHRINLIGGDTTRGPLNIGIPSMVRQYRGAHCAAPVRAPVICCVSAARWATGPRAWRWCLGRSCPGA